jgi:ABC-type Fe3+ transport system permease subunit
MNLLRSFIVGLFAIAAASAVSNLLAHRQQSIRRAAWILLLAPYFTPTLLTGYAYANFSLSLIHHPTLNEVFYAALLWLKFTPIAAVILHFTPSPISAQAIHCRRLLTVTQTAGLPYRRPPACGAFADQAVGGTADRRSALRMPHWIFLARAGCARGLVAAFALVFLCAFTEFEMASLMNVKTWTVALFDAHAGGLALGESLRRVIGPLLAEAMAVGLAVTVLARQNAISPTHVAEKNATNALGWCHLGTAFLVVLLIPAATELWGGIRGFGLLLENFVLGREILFSLLFAAGATVVSALTVFAISGARRDSNTGSRLTQAILLLFVCAGLLGPLVLSLSVLAAVQLPGLIFFRDTPVPLVLTLSLILAPLTWVLKRVLELSGRRTAVHLVELMPRSASARDLIWRLSTSGKFWALALIFVWAYWDLTASAILAPIGMTPVTVRLYNLMHYGRIAALSAMTCTAFLAPVFILFLARSTRRWWAPK